VSAVGPAGAHILAADAAGIASAAECLRTGGLVAMPTETVYGLAAAATNAQAVARIFAVKARPRFNPLICHVTGHAAADEIAWIPPLAEALIEAFWPGPLTLVLERRPGTAIVDLVTAGLETVAIRAPAHTIARQLLFAVERPLAAPSANRSGRVSPTTAAHVAADLGGDVDLILDGGPCGVGLESTILGISGGRLTLLRPGAVTGEDIAEVTGVVPDTKQSGPITAPGQLPRHYAPETKLRLEATERRAGEILIGFGPVEGDLSLSPRGDFVEAAARLFALLREADAAGAEAIAVAPVPDRGLGRAINDRLLRAARPPDS